MKESKILAITKTRKRDWPKGTVYYITLQLENGEYITLGKTKPDAFKVGDLVKYEKIWENKRKEIKPAFSRGWGITNRQIAVIGGAILSASGKSDFKTSAEAILSRLEQ